MERSPLHDALQAVGAPLRALSGTARVLGGAALAVALLAVAAWLSRSGMTAAPLLVLAAWVLVAFVVASSVVVARAAVQRLAPHHLGRQLERLGAWRNGSLTTVLEPAASGTSDSLHLAAASLRAEEVRSRAPDALADAMRVQRRHRHWAAASLVLACIGLIAARPATGAPARLWHPVAAWRALVAPVQLAARRSTVSRGERAQFDLSAVGHRRATLYTRSPGEAWHQREIDLDLDGHATVTSEPLVADMLARVEAGGRQSREVRVGVRLAAFLGAFTATAHYPAYLGLEDETLPTGGDTLLIPEGTRLSLAGRATAPLSAVRLVGTGETQQLTVAGTAFHGDLSPRHDGTWTLGVSTVNGAALEGDPPSLAVRMLADSAPVVDIPVPGADTVASASMSLSLAVAIRDDHGLTAATLETRRGGSGSITRTSLPLPPGGGDRALLTTTIDFTALGLHPGDTLRYAVTALDNAPTHHAGRSREFLVRIPTEAEQRAARARETAQTSTGFDSLSRQAARAQRTEEDLARERQRTDARADGSRPDEGSQKQPLTSEAARKAQAAAQVEQKVIDDAAKLQQSVRDLQAAAEHQGASDTAVARELSEINKLLDKALSPELRASLTQLQQSLQNLDADQTRQSMQDLAQRQAQTQAALDQARELFKRAALEGDLTSMGQDARQLAAEQHAANDKLAAGDSTHTPKTEADLARRADSLAAGLDRAAAQIPSPATQAGLQQAGAQARDAASKMRKAAQSSQAGKQSEAKDEGKQAEDELNPLSKKIDDDRQSMQAEMRAEVKQALERALDETSRLAQHQLAVAQAFQQGALLPGTRAEEGVVEEGAAKVMQQVAAVSAMNALVSPQAGVALAEARRLMREAIDAASGASPNARDITDKSGDAVDALAVAAFSLLQSKDKVDGSQSGSGVQEAMEQMKQMAGKQGQLAQQGAGMMAQGQMSVQQLMQMAMQQRSLAQQLDRMRAGGLLPGAGELARTARDLSHDLEAGRLNQDVVNGQQKLFKRMLDAGRTLQGEQDDDQKQRQSTTAKDAPPAIPPALDPRIRNGIGEIRLPAWESMQRLSPDERRRVVEYFQRLTQVTRP